MAGKNRIIYEPGYRSPVRFIVVVVGVVVIIAVGLLVWNFFASRDTTSYTILRVIDGDTVEVTDGWRTQKVRLIGIDTPEKYNVPVAQCYAEEASEHLAKLLPEKMTLRNDTSQADKDKYGRLLRYIFTADGTNIDEEMIADGYAYEYTYDNAYEYQTEFKAAQAKAKADGKGLWAKDTCDGQRMKPVSGDGALTAKSQDSTENSAVDSPLPSVTPATSTKSSSSSM